MASNTYPTVTPRVGNYNEAHWRPLIDLRLDPGYFLETFKYGLGSYYFDFLDLVGRTMNLTTDNPKIFEKLEWENTVKIESEIAISGAAGDPFSLVVSTDDRDTNGKVPIKVGDGIVVPAQFQAANEDRIYVITAYDSGTYTATCEPLSEAGTYITKSEIDVAIPAGSVLKIHAYYTARGTDLPDGKYNKRVERDYQTQIIKVDRKYEGGMQSLKWWQVESETGATSAWWEGQDEMELDFRKACDDALFLGELNDNTDLVETSGVDGDNPHKSTKGIWNWALEYGQPLDYAGSWDMSYMYDVKDLFLATNTIAREAMFMVGTDLLRYIEESNLDFLKEYSGGSDLMRAADEIGIETRRVLVNGILFQLHELKSFGNPLRYGNKLYNFSKYGLIVPEGQENMTMDGKREIRPNFMIGYLNNNGENRTRIQGIIDGTTGRSIPTHRGDYSEAFIQCEMASIVLHPEQLIPVQPE